MVEERGPLLAGTVRGHNYRSLFIAQRDDVEEQVGARLVNRESAAFVEAEQGRFRVLSQFGFETASVLGGCPRVEHLNGPGKEHRVALAAGGSAQRGRQGGPGRHHSERCGWPCS
jgi:hypothetical protein